jgi:transcriptional regulator with XRE-family HTH domain
MHVGEIIREARRTAALSQYELASQAKVSRYQLICIEQGMVDPRIGTVKKLCDALNVEIHFHEHSRRKDNGRAHRKDRKRG